MSCKCKNCNSGCNNCGFGQDIMNPLLLLLLLNNVNNMNSSNNMNNMYNNGYGYGYRRF